MSEGFKFKAMRSRFTGLDIDLYMYRRGGQGGGTDIVQDLIVESMREGTEPAKPSFQIDRDQAQNLLDELYALGVRPSEVVDDRGAERELKATKHHLEDMRLLAKVPPVCTMTTDAFKPVQGGGE